jgi:hypothetical protein
MPAEKRPSDWNEEDLKGQIELAGNGDVRSAKGLSDYYEERDDFENAKYWLIKTCEGIEALPSERCMKMALPTFYLKLGRLDQRISDHETSAEALKGYVQSAENGDLNSTLYLIGYYQLSEDYEKAIPWLIKTRDLIETLPPEHWAKPWAEKHLDDMLAHMEKMKAFYAMDDEALEQYAKKIEAGGIINAYHLCAYYEHHGNFEEAIRWLIKFRELFEERFADEKYTEERKEFLRHLSDRQKDLEKKAELARAEQVEKTGE